MKLAIALAFSVAAAAPALGAEVNAVASFSILGDMVARVGGDRVAVTTIVGPNADSHVYEPRPSDAAAVAGADIFFINGLGFEGWMDRFVEATGYTGSLVVASDGVEVHEMAELAEGEHGHEHGDHEDHEGHDHEEGDEHGHDHGGTDPHAWQSLANAVAYANNIAAGLCTVDVDGCDGYKANADAYTAELLELDARVREQLAAIPADKRKVITTHDAFGYFGEAYGVQFLAPEGISTDSEASAAQVARLITQIKEEGVTALFVENMSDPRLLQQIATETGLTPGGELYSDALSDRSGPAPTYLDMFRYNVGLLVPAMEGK
ncbi:MAG TPA: metal ABC transporter substrate-binding protein [Devosia sp.]|nr:metal ABC transporter substrate-binding protein [Devosia sp.]